MRLASRSWTWCCKTFSMLYNTTGDWSTNIGGEECCRTIFVYESRWKGVFHEVNKRTYYLYKASGLLRLLFFSPCCRICCNTLQHFFHRTPTKIHSFLICLFGMMFVGDSRGYKCSPLVVSSAGSGRVQLWCKANAKASLLRLCWAEAHTRCGNCKFEETIFRIAAPFFVLWWVIWLPKPFQMRCWCWFFEKPSRAQGGIKCIKTQVLCLFLSLKWA